MKKKTISLFTLMAFIIFSVSCATSTVKQMRVKTAVEEKGSDITILGVMKTSGEYIGFSKKQPSWISDNTIEGKTFDKQESVSIPWSEVKYLIIEETNPKKTETYIVQGAVLVATLAAFFLFLAHSFSFRLSF
jgi:hypothetical protein